MREAIRCPYIRMEKELIVAIESFIEFTFEHLFITGETALLSHRADSALAWKVVLAALRRHEIKPRSIPEGGYINLRFLGGADFRIKIPGNAPVTRNDLQLFEAEMQGKGPRWLTNEDWQFFPPADCSGKALLFTNSILHIIVNDPMELRDLD